MDKVKKVLFTATVDSHILHFHIPYLKMFKDMGYETHVATNSDEAIPYCDKKYKISFERSPFKLNNLKAIKQLKKVVEKEKFDIIHCHTPMGSVVTRLASKHARKAYGTRVIYTAHGFHFYKGAPKINWLIFYPVEKYLSKYTDDLITINNEDYELAIKKFKAKRTHYVPGVGVDPKKFDFELSQEERHELRKSLGIKDDDIVLIYVAELNKNKNQIMAIKAMEKLIVENSKYKLLLVGKDSYNGEYQRLVQELKLENNVIFTGYRKDVPKLMKVSNIAISTSLREGLPVNLIEATMCSLPIVATNCRGNRDVVSETNNGISVPLNDINQFVNEIIKVKLNNNVNTKVYELDEVLKKIEGIYFGNKTFPIRVLQVIGSMNMGGAENFIMNLYRNIDKEKIQFDFISHKPGIFDDEIRKLGGKIYYLDYVTKVGPIKYKKELNMFFKKHNEYKILHTHIDQTSGIVLDVARKYNFEKLIVHSHSTNNSNNVLVNMYKKTLQKKIIKYANIRLACSDAAGKWLYRGLDFRVINNGIDIEKFYYKEEFRSEIRNELNISKESFVIGHVGRFCQVKNHDMLIDIFYEYNKYNNNSYLLLVGDGPLKEEIEKKCEKLKIKDKVKFLGIRKDVNKMYSTMDVFVFPSFHEGFPVTVVEAACSGVPMLLSDKITNEVKFYDKIKFVGISDSSEWVNEIKNMKNSREVILSEKLKRFDAKTISKEYENIILEGKI